jgi:hypothetical protein
LMPDSPALRSVEPCFGKHERPAAARIERFHRLDNLVSMVQCRLSPAGLSATRTHPSALAMRH